MAGTARLYGVHVARHDPNLDHGARFDVVGCGRRDCDGIGGFVNDVHFVYVGCLGLGLVN